MHADSRLWSCALLLLSVAQAFYIPGYSIKSYRDGERIPLFVNKVYSDYTELQYAYSELPFICPSSGRNYDGLSLISGTSVSLNLGEVLRGDRIVVSDYDMVMGNDEEARYLCAKTIDRTGFKKAQEIIADGYIAEWIVDNLPGATSFVTTDKSRKYYASGFKMGYVEYSPSTGKPRFYINNHVTLVIRFHKAREEGKKVIVGFEVYPKSIEAGNRHDNGLPLDIHDVESPMELSLLPNKTDNHAIKYADSYVPEDEQEAIDDGATLTIPYTYSVYFREEEHLEWQNRWDMYFVAQEDSTGIHWLAIVNSLVISGLLSAIVAVIFARTIRADFKSFKETGLEEGKAKIKRTKGTRSPRKSGEKGGLLEQPGEADLDADLSSDDESIEEVTGWKLLHGDVFRTPSFGGLLAPLVGSGMQLVFMAVGQIVLSCFGVLNPSFRGGFISVGFALFIFAGIFSGYYSARVYKTFGGKNWKKNCMVTATLIPGLLFATIFILNLFVWAQASSTALPFGTLVGLVALWLLVQLPLVYLGTWYGYERVGAWEHPTKTTSIPRQIPQQHWYTKSIRTILLAGLVPFAVIFIELLFVFKNVWQDKTGYYYVFGFLAVVSFILMVSVVQVSIIATYAQLCAENHYWWWQSFFVGGSSSIWIFAYCVWFYFAKLHITGIVSSLLFFSYSFLACAVYGLLTGTIGFLASYAFVRRIYGAIKAD